jgi:hypothetical protein
MKTAARAIAWFENARQEHEQLEARARTFSFVLARTLGLMLASEHAEWLLARNGDGRGLAVVTRLGLELGEIRLLEEPSYYSNAVAFPVKKP